MNKYIKTTHTTNKSNENERLYKRVHPPQHHFSNKCSGSVGRSVGPRI
jgi:hypothetical protein